MNEPEELFEEFEYDSQGRYAKNRLPDLALMILDDRHIRFEERIKFYNDFLIEYVNNPEFQKQWDGHFILFYGMKYIGPMTHENIHKKYKIGCKICLYRIGEQTVIYEYNETEAYSSVV